MMFKFRKIRKYIFALLAINACYLVCKILSIEMETKKEIELVLFVNKQTLIPYMDNNSIFTNLYALYIASNDPNITTLHIVLEESNNLIYGWYAEELLKIIFVFKLKGKKVIFWGREINGITTMMIASACTESYIPSTSSLSITGLQFFSIFEGNRNEKKQIIPWGVQFGDFKGGLSNDMGYEFDMYSATNLREFLFDLWQQAKIVMTITNQPNVEILAKHSYFTITQAVNLKLISGVGVFEMKKNMYEVHEFYQSVKKPGVPNVCVMAIDFPIIQQITEPFIQELWKIAKNPNISVVILIIHCNGGETVAVENLDAAIMNLRAKGKFVIALISKAFSGGYWVATAADVIISANASWLGSIGSYILCKEMYKRMQKKGYTSDCISTHAPVYYDRLTNKEKEFMKLQNEEIGKAFGDKVASRRRIVDIDSTAKGQIFTGKAGLKLNLVDATTGLFGVMNLTYQLLGYQPMIFAFI